MHTGRVLRLVIPPIVTGMFILWADSLTAERFIWGLLDMSSDGTSAFGAIVTTTTFVVGAGYFLGSLTVLVGRHHLRFEIPYCDDERAIIETHLDCTAIPEHKPYWFSPFRWDNRRAALAVFRVHVLPSDIQQWLFRRADSAWTASTCATGIGLVLIFECAACLFGFAGRQQACGIQQWTFIAVGMASTIIFYVNARVAAWELRRMTHYCLGCKGLWPHNYDEQH